MSDHRWIIGGRIALMVGLLLGLAMLGAPWFRFSDDIKKDIITIIGSVAAFAVGRIFNPNQSSGK